MTNPSENQAIPEENQEQNQNTQERSNQQNLEEKRKNIISVLVKEFWNFLLSYKNPSISDLPKIWQDFLQSKHKNTELILGLKELFEVEDVKEVSWDMIKNLSVSLYSTFGNKINYHLAENFYLPEFGLSTLKAYIDKIKKFSKENNHLNLYNFHLVPFERQVIKVLKKENFSKNDVKKLYKQFDQVLVNFYTDLPSELQKQFQKLSIESIDILDIAVKYGFLTQEDLEYIRDDLSSDLKQQYIINSEKLKWLNDFKNRMLLMWVGEELDKYSKAVDKVYEKIRNVFAPPSSFGELLKREIELLIDLQFIKSHFRQIYDVLPDNLQQRLHTLIQQNCGRSQIDWNKITDCEAEQLQVIVAELMEEDNPEHKLENFIQLLRLASPEKANLVERILQWNLIDAERMELVRNLIFSPEYIEKAAEMFGFALQFSEEETERFKQYLKDFLWNGRLRFYDQEGNLREIPFDIDVILPTQLSNPAELLEANIAVRWQASATHRDNLQQLFPHLYHTINNVTFSIWNRIKVTDRNGQSYEGYPVVLLNGGLVLFDTPTGDRNLVKEFEPEDIPNLQIEIVDDSVDVSFISLDDHFPGTLMVLAYAVKDPNYRYEDFLSNVAGQGEQIQSAQQQATDVQQEEREKRKLYKQFLKERDTLNGDPAAQFTQWTRLFLRVDSLPVPGVKSEYIEFEITQIDRENLRFQLTAVGWISFQAEQAMGRQIWVDITPEIIRNWKFSTYGYVYKFKLATNANDFFEDYLKNLWLQVDDREVEIGINRRRSQNLKWENSKLYRIDKNWKKEEIRYLGKTLHGENKFIAYEVKFEENKVILKHPNDKNFKLELDYNSFLLLIGENKLYPWSDKDYQTEISVHTDVNGLKKPMTLNWMSWGQMKLSFSHFKRVFLNYMKKDDEFREAIFYEHLTKFAYYSMAWAPGISQILKQMKYEAKWERETKVMKVIEMFKEDLIRADDGKWANHWKVASEIIKTKIFDKVLAWKELSYTQKLAAAWYLLYAIERWPGPYFRKLSDYSWKWVWVRALLGEAHYRRWKAIHTQLIEKLKIEPDNQTLRDELVKSEIFYIKDQSDTWNWYSQSYPTLLEGMYIDKVYSSSKAEEIYKNEKEKGNFYLIYEAWKSYVNNNRPPNSLWAFKALAERVEDYSHYVNMYKAVFINIFTWYAFNNYVNQYREDYERILRTYGYVVGRYAFDNMWIQKIGRIINYILKKKNISLYAKGLISKKEDEYNILKYLYGSDADKILATDLWGMDWANYKQRKTIEKMEKLWDLIGSDIVKSLDYTDLSLLEHQDVDSQIQQDIQEYFDEYVMDKEMEDWALDRDIFKTAHSPYFKEGIWNLPAKTFNAIALRLDEGEFEQEWLSFNFWRNLIRQLQKFSTREDKQIYAFVLKKFLSWFPTKLSQKSKQKFVASLKYLQQTGDATPLRKFILEDFVKSLSHYGVPDIVEEWMEAFVNFWVTGRQYLPEVWPEIFGRQWEDVNTSVLEAPPELQQAPH